MKTTVFNLTALAFILSFLMVSPEAWAGSQDRPVPKKIDPSKYYVFYMHGTAVENDGPSKDNKYYDILDALEAKGLVTIGEVRSKIDIMKYAKKVAKQVKGLIKAGVPAKNITVSGHSRGAHITMRVSAVLKNPQVRFIPISGCGYKVGQQSIKNYTQFTQQLAPKAKGQWMNMWEKGDKIAGKCDAAMKRAKGITYVNKMLTVGGGHQLFWKPKSSWIDPFVGFVKGG
ncbi:MAG: hypothetical protein HQ513_16315 [Rhodospirillales bacterium]|nr:hypothetical protein [Rhodospirillales bacterium]